MHEFGIIQNIFGTLEEVAAANQLRAINKVVLRIGNYRQVVPEFLKFAFQTLARDSIAENAELVIIHVPISFNCRGCGRKFEVEDKIYACPHCCSVDLEILTGKELILDQVEGDN